MDPFSVWEEKVLSEAQGMLPALCERTLFMKGVLSRGLVPTVYDHCFLASPVNSPNHPALPLNCSSSWCKAAPLSCSFLLPLPNEGGCSSLLGLSRLEQWFSPGLHIQWALLRAGAVAAGFGKVPRAGLLARAWDRPGARTRTTSISHMCHKAASSSAACKASWLFLPLPFSPCHDIFFSVLRQQVSQTPPFCF